MLYEYVAGLVFGDGCLYYDKSARMYYIYVYDRCRDFLETVAELVRQELDCRSIRVRKLYSKNSYELRIAGKSLYYKVQALIKRNRVKPSIDFIRGLTDAEGTMYIDKYNGATIEISNTDKTIVENVRKKLFEHGIKLCMVVENRKPSRKNSIRYASEV